MLKDLYRKLAVITLRNNKRSYIPFVWTMAGMAAMYLILTSLSVSKTLSTFQGMSTMQEVLRVAVWVDGIFAAVFIFYTNSFLMRRRKREFSLYQMLGMEKKHMIKTLAWETIFTGTVGILGGILLGSVLYKLAEGMFFKVIGAKPAGGYLPESQAVWHTLLLFGAIVLCCFIGSVGHIYRAAPVTLLRESRAGEKPPRINWPVAVGGAVCLGVGYYMAVTAKRPLQSMQTFFQAALLVMAGTYACFTQLSILLLGALRRNKAYYYKTKHFTAVSGLIFRIRQNAVGLANICLLSTMVLILASSAVSFYLGGEDILRHRYPRNIMVSSLGGYDKERVSRETEALSGERGLTPENLLAYEYSCIVGRIHREGTENRIEQLPAAEAFMTDEAIRQVFFISLDEVKDTLDEKLGETLSLRPGEVYMIDTGKSLQGDRLLIGDASFFVKRIFSGKSPFFMDDIIANVYVIAADKTEAERGLSEETENERGYVMGFDLTASDKTQAEFAAALRERLAGLGMSVDSVAENKKDFLEIYGALFFTGIFLGLVFMTAVALIIYYKQLVEGYEDRKRYDIMQKIGMSKREIKSAIRSQVLTVFFMPLLMAGSHMAFAFPVLVKLLTLLNMNNVRLFMLSSMGVYLLFALIYMMTYRMTSRVYYELVTETDV